MAKAMAKVMATAMATATMVITVPTVAIAEVLTGQPSEGGLVRTGCV